MIQHQYVVKIPYGNGSESERFESWMAALPSKAVTTYMFADGLTLVTDDLGIAEVFDAYSEGLVEEKLDEIGWTKTLSAADHLELAARYAAYGFKFGEQAELAKAEEKFNA